MSKYHVEKKYDVVVVGGGLSGVCAAIASARGGAKTAIIQNRSMFGGNASSEIRMHVVGANSHGAKKDLAETGILLEILLENMNEDERLSLLIPTESLFADLPAVKLPAFYEKLCRSGCEIYQNKIKSNHKVGQRVRICNEKGEFFALGEVKEYENGTAIKAIKTFNL